MEAAGPDQSLTDVTLLAVCLEAFAGFMRCDELIKLKCNDITLTSRVWWSMCCQVRPISLESKVHLWLLPAQVLQLAQ